MKSSVVINSTETLSKFLGDVREAWSRAKWLKVTYTDGKPRTLNQNDQIYVWYTQIANELREQTILEVRCECKLNLGVPILRAENDEFRALYDKAIKHHLSYEEKLEAMKFLQVTSLMTRDQLSQYHAAMQKMYEKRGVILKYKKQEEA